MCVDSNTHAKVVIHLLCAVCDICREKMPELHVHIEEIGLSYSIFSTKWFICLYIDVLPIEVNTSYVIIVVWKTYST